MLYIVQMLWKPMTLMLDLWHNKDRWFFCHQHVSKYMARWKHSTTRSDKSCKDLTILSKYLSKAPMEVSGSIFRLRPVRSIKVFSPDALSSLRRNRRVKIWAWEQFIHSILHFSQTQNISLCLPYILYLQIQELLASFSSLRCVDRTYFKFGRLVL